MNPEEVLTARARARVGQTLHEKWHLDHLLGVGGMAAVYAATHRNGARAAIKILHLELSLDNEVRQRFLREGYAANAVGHPGVVRALDDDAADDSSVFLVMELLEGETLDERWERLGQRLPVDETLTVAEELLSILEAAHLRGIVHRDLKPENLFVTPNGLKLLDFGIARVREGALASATRTGMTAGTPAFMAPEQALGHSASVGPHSDLWAVGALMFTMLTGRYVHEGQSANEIMIRTATRPAPAIKTVRGDLSDDVAAVIDRALAFEVAARWASATEMREAVRQAREGGGMRSRSLAPPPLSARAPDSDAAIIAPTSLRPGSESRILGPSSFSSESLPAGGAEATGGRRMVLPGIALGLALMGIVVTVALRSSSGLPSSGHATASATSVSAPVSAAPPVVAPSGPTGSRTWLRSW